MAVDLIPAQVQEYLDSLVPHPGSLQTRPSPNDLDGRSLPVKALAVTARSLMCGPTETTAALFPVQGVTLATARRRSGPATPQARCHGNCGR